MRVSIEHNTKSTGWIVKKPYVDVVTSVAFSEEELAIIRSKKLQKFTILERGADCVTRRTHENHQEYLARLSGFEMTIGKLMKGPDSYPCETPMHAKQYEAEVAAALKNLKNFITGNAQAAQSTSFEL